MQCPRCGGFHDGYQPPPPTIKPTNPVAPLEAHDFLQSVLTAGRQDPYERDVLPDGKPGLWEPRIYGVNEAGTELTLAIGVPGSTKEHQVLAKQSFVAGWEFYAHDNHDHFGPKRSKDRGQS